MLPVNQSEEIVLVAQDGSARSVISHVLLTCTGQSVSSHVIVSMVLVTVWMDHVNATLVTKGMHAIHPAERVPMVSTVPPHARARMVLFVTP